MCKGSFVIDACTRGHMGFTVVCVPLCECAREKAMLYMWLCAGVSTSRVCVYSESICAFVLVSEEWGCVCSHTDMQDDMCTCACVLDIG